MEGITFIYSEVGRLVSYDFGDRNKSNAISTIARMCDSGTLTIITHSAHVHCVVSNNVLKCEVLQCSRVTGVSNII
jgi:hypothetical protein